MTDQIDTIDKAQLAQWGADEHELYRQRMAVQGHTIARLREQQTKLVSARITLRLRNIKLRGALRRARHYVELELTAHQKAEMLVPEELQSLLDEIDALI